jgi:Spy/CpxP family protein refolding chaperone
MSLKNKLFAGAFAVSAFAVAGFAQEAKPEAKEVTKDGDTKVERKARKFEGRGINGGMLKEQLRQIHEANKPDRAVIEETHTLLKAKFAGTATAEQEARLQALKAQGREKAKAVRAQVEAVFTPEQKAQIEQRKQEMKTKMVEMRERFKERHNEFFKDKSTTKPAEVKKDN